MKKTLLFPNAGRRVELIQRFQTTAKKESINLTVIGTDITANAPALSFCDKTYLVKKERNLNTLNRYLEIIKANSVDIVICTIDPDLEFFSKHRDILSTISSKKSSKKVELLLSDANIIDASSDKQKTSDFFNKIGVSTPKLYDQESIDFPVFAKPIKGSGSFGAKLILDASDLQGYLIEFADDTPIFQEYISGKEYTLDCYVDFKGEIIVSPRERIRVRGGEVTVSKTIELPELENQSKKILSSGGFYGPITLQAIQDEVTGNYYFIEINPRFGGGSILSIEAGLNSPYHILTQKNDWFNGLKRNLTMMRYDMSVFSQG
ncbi:MAG: ATP-grasp domain-containing protein [Proteobacteria bacterium]|nr:ATP-grasp domain-containing protein [Pseudomonadota bacterium]